MEGEFKASIGYGEVLVEFEGNSSALVKAKDTAPYSALMTLHVISGAGFGVRQVWDDDEEEQLGIRAIPGFNTAKLEETTEWHSRTH